MVVKDIFVLFLFEGWQSPLSRPFVGLLQGEKIDRSISEARVHLLVKGFCSQLRANSSCQRLES